MKHWCPKYIKNFCKSTLENEEKENPIKKWADGFNLYSTKNVCEWPLDTWDELSIVSHQGRQLGIMMKPPEWLKQMESVARR